ncbi:MAG: acyl-CoA thioesterase [Burkholderiales bacterium]|nr:acyl-CoA thioesterase [Burkholderiales bacterium]
MEPATPPTQASGSVFVREKLIRFHHCDPAGIVFYPQYFVLFNELVEDWFTHGLHEDYATMIAVDRVGVPMAHVDCDFVSPSKIGDMLRLELRVKRVGRTSLSLDVEGSSRGELRVKANLVVVFASLDDTRPVPIPGHVREHIERFLH